MLPGKGGCPPSSTVGASRLCSSFRGHCLPEEIYGVILKQRNPAAPRYTCTMNVSPTGLETLPGVGPVDGWISALWQLSYHQE